jgi:hypothetical protein
MASALVNANFVLCFEHVAQFSHFRKPHFSAFRYAGARLVGMVYGSAEKPGEILSNQTLMRQAEALGRKMAGR